MKMTIYLPDELGERVKAAPELNISAVCQEALVAELDRRVTLAELDHQMERFVCTVEDNGTGKLISVAFTGRHLASDHNDEIHIYLTARHRYAVEDTARSKIYDFDTLDDIEEAGFDPQLLALAADELGDERVVELDI